MDADPAADLGLVAHNDINRVAFASPERHKRFARGIEIVRVDAGFPVIIGDAGIPGWQPQHLGDNGADLANAGSQIDPPGAFARCQQRFAQPPVAFREGPFEAPFLGNIADNAGGATRLPVWRPFDHASART